MNIFKLITLYTLLIIVAQADSKKPRLFHEGEDYRVSIYESKVVIERLSDGEKRDVDGLLWAENPMYHYQPTNFFNDESNMAVFLMESYQYWVVDVDALFRDEDMQLVYERIEAAVTVPTGVRRDNLYWDIDGIYPNKTLKGSAVVEDVRIVGNELLHGQEVSFTLHLVGEKAYTLETSNKDAARIIKIRAIDYKCTTESHFRYVFK